MRSEARKLEENHEGKRKAYMQIAFYYSDYLLDDEAGLFYFKRALEYARLAGDDTDDDDYRYLLIQIMGRADVCAIRRNDDARRERLRLCRRKSKT